MQFLSDASPCSLISLKDWLQSNESKLTDEIRHWAPKFSYGLDEQGLRITFSGLTHHFFLCF